MPEGRGVYTREEWAQARRVGYNDAGPESAAIDTEVGFLRRAFGGERRKLESGLRLADHLKQAGYRSVLEVGCGEMITSWAIKSRLPEIRYLATDYDDFVVAKCRRLRLLEPIEKACLDVDAVTVAELQPFDVVVAWEVFYAFDTVRFVRFLEKVKAADSALIICSGQLVGPLRAASYLVKSRMQGYAGRCERGEVRAHGFKCSVGHYRQIAAGLGLACRLVGDCYVFLEFTAR